MNAFSLLEYTKKVLLPRGGGPVTVFLYQGCDRQTVLGTAIHWDLYKPSNLDYLPYLCAIY